MLCIWTKHWSSSTWMIIHGCRIDWSCTYVVLLLDLTLTWLNQNTNIRCGVHLLFVACTLCCLYNTHIVMILYYFAHGNMCIVESCMKRSFFLTGVDYTSNNPMCIVISTQKVCPTSLYVANTIAWITHLVLNQNGTQEIHVLKERNICRSDLLS